MVVEDSVLPQFGRPGFLPTLMRLSRRGTGGFSPPLNRAARQYLAVPAGLVVHEDASYRSPLPHP
jgi:hypothetical protein